VASTTVLYILEAGGNLAEKLPELATGLDSVRAKAAQTASTVGGALADAAGAGRQALHDLGEEGKNALEGLFKAGAVLAAFAYGTNQILKSNEEWAQSTARLSDEIGRLGQRIADELGPTAAAFLDSFTLGLTYLVTFVEYAVWPAIEGLSDLLDMVKAGLGEWVTLFDRIIHGDFSGALKSITDTQTRQLDDLKGALEAVRDGFAEANGLALDAAKGAYTRATDGRSDVALKSIDWSDEAKKFQPLIYALYSVSEDLKSKALPALGKAETAAQSLADALPQFEAKLEEGLRQALVQGFADKVGGLHSAASQGLGSLTGALGGGPIGAALFAILDLVGDLPNLVAGLEDEAMSIFADLPNQLLQIGGELIPQFVSVFLPELAANAVLLEPAITLAIVESIPHLIAATVTMIPEFIRDLIEGFKAMFLSILPGGSAFNDISSGVASIFVDPMAAIRNIGRDLGFGGHDSSRSLAPHSTTSSSRIDNRSSTIRIDKVVANDPRMLADQLRQLKGRYGIGLKTDPLAG
jgi:hypothetical protein